MTIAAQPSASTALAAIMILAAQRASAGLIVSEGTWISPLGKGYAWTPGIHTQAQIDGWRLVTDAVHAEGGKIVVQLWHVGRISVNSLQPGGQPPVSSRRAPTLVTMCRDSGYGCSASRMISLVTNGP